MAGGVLGLDGCIYFAPGDTSRVLRIATDGNVEQIGPEIEGGGEDPYTWEKYRTRGVVGQDGCIYFAPSTACRVLHIAVDGNVEQVGPQISGDAETWRYVAGGLVGQDGCIYFAPRDASRVLRIAVD